MSQILSGAYFFIVHQRRGIVRLLLLPKKRDFGVLALTDNTLVIVAKPLLSPKRALSLEVNFVSPEEWCRLKLLK